MSQNSIVGQSGLEWYYDRYLRGVDGDRAGPGRRARAVQRAPVGETPPQQGHSLKLSLDINLQRAGQDALQEAINDNPPATGGAFVAMNPENGEVYAMGSLPTFNPNIFAKPVSASTYRR